MKDFRYDNPQLFEAFVKSAQYLVRLKTQQDVWEQLGKFIVTYFPANWTAFVERDPVKGISLRHCTLPEANANETVLTDEVRNHVDDVLESGFLTTQIIPASSPSMTAFLPIVEEYRTEKVLLIGHKTAEPLSNELLNIYLAIAGLAGTTFERLQNELELNRHRAHLEELVKERTGELAQAKRQNELILNSVGEGICGIDLDGRITFVNPSAAQILGWEQDELIGKNAHSTFHQTRADGCFYPVAECPVYAALKNGTANYITSEMFLRRDGSAFPVEFMITPIIEEHRITGAVIIFHDITERKRAEEAVVRAKEEWELTFNTVPDLVMILDREHRLLRVNKASADRLGLEPEECIGLRCYEAVHGLSHPPELCPHKMTCEDGTEHITDLRESRIGGHFLVSTTPMRDGKGKLVGSIHVARDITERKLAEEEIGRLNERLQQRASELEASNKELEAFSYSVSHDLRAPLRHMDGFSRLLLESYADKLDDEGRQYLQTICSSSVLMAELIDDLLNLSRITRAEIHLKKVNLSDMAGVTISELKRAHPGRNADWKITTGLEAYGDGRLLKLVFDNLLGNALKFTEKCPGARIEFGAVKHNGEQVYFVRDNGAGFDMSYSHKLFQPFQRLHSAEEFPGTGIGLATVQRIINRLGGRVRAEGETGKGATFYFTLGQKVTARE